MTLVNDIIKDYEMPFPESKRVIYKKNPLDKVICQLRFPPILTIDAEIPAKFQDRIRDDFPNFLESSEPQIEMPREIKGQIPPEIFKRMFPITEQKNYEFSSEDEFRHINLTRNFIALSTEKYERWEQFRRKFEDLFSALIDIYNPKYFSRIGLRYIDIIKRSDLNLDNVGWDELLQPFVLGIISSPGFGKNVQNFESMYEIKLSDNESTVKMVTKFVKHKNSDETCFMIDSDFYNSIKKDVDLAFDKLDYFNKNASRLIQWVLTERLHKAMEPQKI